MAEWRLTGQSTSRAGPGVNEDGFGVVGNLRSLGEARIRTEYGVTVLCVKPEGESFTYATPETVLEKGAVLVVASASGKAEAFAHLA